MKRILKRQARKLFNRGEKVYMAPSKMNLWSMWFSPVCMDNNEDFEKNVNSFRYYNCNVEDLLSPMVRQYRLRVI